MIKIFKLSFILLFLAMIQYEVHSAISLRLKEIPDDSTYRTINTENSPLFHAFIKANKDGQQFNVTPENIIIQENNRAAFPMEVDPPDEDGWQKVSWYPVMRGYFPLNITRFIVFDGNEHSYIHGAGPYAEMPRVRIYTIKHEPIPEIDFGRVLPGDTLLEKVKVFALTAAIKDGKEQPIHLDSVKTHTDAFRHEWKGSVFDRTSIPPMDIYSPVSYKVYLYFHPEDESFYQDKLSVYYEGGLKEELRLKGNEYQFEEKTLLQLNDPSGDETLVPCSTYRIKWEGNILDVPTIIEFSSDNGNNWDEIARVRDTIYDWTVPVLESDNCIIRIRQEFKNTSQESLTVNDIPVRQISYSSNGRKLLSFNEAGEIYEWTLSDLQRKGPYKPDGIDFGETVKPYGLTYLSDDGSFVAVYKESINGKLNLAYFNSGDLSQVRNEQIDAEFSVLYAKSGNSGKILAVVPNMGTEVLIVSLETGQIIRKMDFHAPVTSLSFNQNAPEFFVSLYDGTSRIISATDFNTIREFDFSDLPIILKTDISPNGKYIAIGCKRPMASQISTNLAEIHVVDVETGQIIATQMTSASDPAGLAFSPSSNLLLIGSNYTPQLSLWDLKTNTITARMGSGNTALNDFQFSPDGSSLTMADNSADNLRIKYFTFPESFTSEKFRIVMPQFALEPIEFEPEYFGISTEEEFTTAFCNTGEVPFAIEHAWIENVKSFGLKYPLNQDTLYPGECAEITMVFTPLDTGDIEETLHIITCAEDYKIPLRGYGKPRNIDFYSDMFDFGELCIGEEIEKEIVLAKNNDPVPVKINNISTVPPFYMLSEVKDTILQPGESITVRIRYSPFRLGEMISAIKIFHSDQVFQIPFTELSGKGVGVDVALNLPNMLFIPEIPDRELTVTNKIDNDISIIDYYVEPEGTFEIKEQLPIEIEPLGDKDITIHSTGSDYQKATITLIFDPCETERPFFIRPYSAQSLVYINDVEADPRSEVEIPIEFITDENGSYHGERFFESEITLNPRIFFPESISSNLGKAELTKNEVINDRRVIGFRVEGDFPAEGTIAKIKGVPGLAENDTSMIAFMDDARYWGIATATNTRQGVFRLVGLCGDRRILQEGIDIDMISPLPAVDELNIEFSSSVAGQGSYEIYNDLGIIIEKGNIAISKGQNDLSLLVSGYPPGSYKIIIRSAGLIGIGKIIIVK